MDNHEAIVIITIALSKLSDAIIVTICWRDPQDTHQNDVQFALSELAGTSRG